MFFMDLAHVKTPWLGTLICKGPSCTGTWDMSPFWREHFRHVWEVHVYQLVLSFVFGVRRRQLLIQGEELILVMNMLEWL